MKLRFLFLLLLFPWTAFAQTDFQRQPSIELPAALDRVLRDYERAWQTGDAASLASLFTEDGYVPASAGWIRGRDAIETRYEGATGDLRLRAISYSAADSLGYIVGAYGYGDELAERDRGNFVLALRRSPAGKWLIAADLDKTNRP